MKLAALLTFFIVAAVNFFSATTSDIPFRELSGYRFFEGRLSDLNPADNVFPYEVAAPLFSNYAEKARFIFLPENSQMLFDPEKPFELPLGSVLIKNFYFPSDFTNTESGRKIIETRLLIHNKMGWQAYPYVWNEEQTEAFYEPAGARLDVSYRNDRGKEVTAPYLVPNKNQCRNCHASGDQLVPIGITQRQLDRAVRLDGIAVNQLEHWSSAGTLKGYERGYQSLVDYNDRTQALELRARSYLDSNCGHCHNKDGAANTSGLFLDFYEDDPAQLGIRKTPVAAGRGSGNLPYDIYPGEPKASILLFRMKTNDPGIAMPELGRERVHKEGVDLIDEWIRKMPK